jgi:hypothetical protein
MIIVSGGIVLLIGAIVLAVYMLWKHWNTVWGFIKRIAKDAWHFIYDGIGKYLLPLLGPVGLIALGTIELAKHWSTIWNGIKKVISAAWFFIYTQIANPMIRMFTKDIPHAFDVAVKAITKAWSAVENAVKGPIKWVIHYVLNDGLIHAFNWISSKVGGPTIKNIPELAKGGRLPGYGGGDRNLALLESGETVVPKHLANRSDFSMWARDEGIPGYQRGGLVHGIPVSGGPRLGNTGATGKPASSGGGGLFGGIGKFFHKIWDIGKIVADVFSGDTGALTRAFTDLVGKGVGGAIGDMATLLLNIPKALIKDAIKFLISTGGGASSNSIVKYAMSFIGKVPYQWGGDTPSGWDCSGFVEWVYNHFGIHPPRTSQQQFGWVKRTPGPVPGGLAFFAGADGTQASPGHVGIVINPNRMVDAYATGYGTRIDSLFGSSGALSGFGIPPGGFGGPAPGISGGVSNWIHAAMIATMAPASWYSSLAKLVSLESGGNPRAYNPQVAGSSGEHAEGMWQMIPSTYSNFATMTGGIWNPVSEGVAAIRYIRAKWGSPMNIPGLISGAYGGYARGTNSAMPGLSWVGESGPELVRFQGGEQVYSPGQSAGRRGGGGRAPINIYVHTQEINPIMHAAQLGFELARRSA